MDLYLESIKHPTDLHIRGSIFPASSPVADVYPVVGVCCQTDTTVGLPVYQSYLDISMADILLTVKINVAICNSKEYCRHLM